VKVKDLAAWLEAPWEGEGDRELRKVAALEDAGPGDLSFVTRAVVARALKSPEEAARFLKAPRAGCLLVPDNFPSPDSGAQNSGAQNSGADAVTSRTIIRVKDPRAAVARAISKLHPQSGPSLGIHPTAVIGRATVVPLSCSVGAHAVLGDDVRMGAGTSVGAGAVVGDRVSMGENCTIHANVTIYPEVTIGKGVVLHSGSVIGADGFGYVFNDGAYENFPQIGRVELGDRVEIGANSCVDRAALGVTVIGEGTKLDNMVHIGHNCRIGKHVVIAAQTGLSGGVVVEDYAVIGGQVGIGDKARIETRAVLGSGSGILTSKIVRSGQVVWGTPARPLKEHLASLAVLSRMAKKRKASNE
jgi:UDP-3-O-[3-hydroxymyristoyl] glucosamine N-acyltransferase